jgi:hypothetical protein
MLYVVHTYTILFVVSCVCPWIESSKSNKCGPYQPLVHLDAHYCTQFALHSNLPKNYQP